MTPDEEVELARLHQAFGITPFDALYVRPAWEVDLFCKMLPPLEEADDAPRRRGPSRVPAGLKDMTVG